MTNASITLLRRLAPLPGLLAGLFAAVLPAAVLAAATDLASEPLQTVSPIVRPNLMFILDDSGSMSWDFMPDWASRNPPRNNDIKITDFRANWESNSAVNRLYYDPAVRYTPPIKGDGSSYPSMTAQFQINRQADWKAIPNDGFGVQSDNTSNLENAYYHYFVPDHFCKAQDLRDCKALSAPNGDYRHPALVRWCKSDTSSDCRATPINGEYESIRVPAKEVKVNINKNQLYGDKGAAAKALTRTDCAASLCTYDEEMTNYANWWAYYHTRMQMAKSAASLAFADVDDKLRIGFMTINNATRKGDFLNIKAADTTAGGHKAQWYQKLLAAEPDGDTPLRTALATAGLYYAHKVPNNSLYGVTTEDPVQYACQRNYTMLSTDGYWNDDTPPKQLGVNANIGDQDGNPDVVKRPQLDAKQTRDTLADVAQYFYLTDIRSPKDPFKNDKGALGSDVASNEVEDKQQRMYTSTIGLGASGSLLYRSDYATATTGDYADIVQGRRDWPTPVKDTSTTIDDLWHAAVNGRGTYYSASNADELSKGLQAFIQDVKDGGSVTAVTAAVSNRNLSQDDNIVFKPSYASGSWHGDLISLRVDPDTGEDAKYALWSLSEPRAMASGQTSPTLESKAWDSRAIYTTDPAKVKGTPLLFRWDKLTDPMKALFRYNAMQGLSQFCITGARCVASDARIDSDTSSTGRGVGGPNLVNFLRGDKSHEGKDKEGYYRERSHKLGDIVGAQVVYVRKPMFNYLDKGYADFRTAQASRQAMVYAAANDGMVHAIRADNGQESWAYIPSILLSKLYKLADKNYAEAHQNYVNATPQQGDIMANGTWRTILVGGFGQGARGYYALDITNADKPPTVLWEFTHDSAQGAGYTADTDMGYAYGTPEITKLSDGTWVVILASGYNNVNPGSGHGIVWVLNAYTGAVLHKIDTGKGNANSAVPGCAKAPCPSGLAHVRAFAATNNTNNTSSHVYAGDLLGHLWRIDISKLTADKGSTATVQLLTTFMDLGDRRQPVTSAPELGSIQGANIVYIGTGKYLGETDVASSDMQTFYAIKDPLTVVPNKGVFSAETPRKQKCPKLGPASDCFIQNYFLDLDNGKRRDVASEASYAANLATMNGWFIDLQKIGERVVSRADLQLGIIAFTSIMPSETEPCKVGGQSYINYLDYATGLKLAGLNEGSSLLGNDSGTSIASGVYMVRLKGGKVVLRTNQGPGPVIDRQGSAQTRRLSWRELITD
ncbi:MAG: PilC/PilY family type IV pilus protein [Aquabacterium sp.]